MSASVRDKSETDNSRRIMFIVIGVAALLLIGGLWYLKSRPETGPGAGGRQQRLEGALRAGSPEFEKYSQLISLDKPEADEATRAIGDIMMTLRTTVRNFTGRTINGLEMRAAVVDHQKRPVKEKTVVVIPNPTRPPELENNKTLPVQVLLEGMSKTDDRADIEMEVTGFTFK